jgi:hypothetical protein
LDLGYCPLTYFWIAHYDDGTVLPQFDLDTGKENQFLKVEKNRLVKFGYYPFSVDFGRKIGKAGIFVIPTNNPIHEIEIGKFQEIETFRENELGYGFNNLETTGRNITYALGIKGSKLIKFDEDGKIIYERKCIRCGKCCWDWMGNNPKDKCEYLEDNLITCTIYDHPMRRNMGCFKFPLYDVSVDLPNECPFKVK